MPILRRIASVWLAIAAALAALPAVAEMELVMIEQPGCIYCARWDKDIAEIYPKTAEGAAAPLRRLQLHAPLPDGMTLASKPVYTPTFILLEDGREIGRIEGYPGEDFFWGLLAQMLIAAGAMAPAASG